MILAFFHFFYKNIIKRILFCFDPETIHNIFLQIGKVLNKRFILKFFNYLFNKNYNSLNQKLFGMEFYSPVGLGAGFDKDADIVNIIHSLGFGFTEIGSITAKRYDGNKKPRLYRLHESKSIIVNYGLKNLGVDFLIYKILKKYKKPLFISIAKTNNIDNCDLNNAINDYIYSFKKIVNFHLDHPVVINISCPNAFGGEDFADPVKLGSLLSEFRKVSKDHTLIVKMPINKTKEEILELVDISVKYNINAITIGNLNKNPDANKISEKIPKNIKGGMSGKLTESLSNELIALVYKHFGKKIKIIGIGGIFNAKDAYKKIRLGSSLVQLVTGMIFEGPQLIAQINKELDKMIKKDGFKNISEVIGIDNK